MPVTLRCSNKSGPAYGTEFRLQDEVTFEPLSRQNGRDTGDKRCSTGDDLEDVEMLSF